MLAWEWQFEKYFASLKNPTNLAYAKAYHSFLLRVRYGRRTMTSSEIFSGVIGLDIAEHQAKRIRARIDKLHNQ